MHTTSALCPIIFKIKLIETRLRSSINQELLKLLLFICIERDKIPHLDEISCYVYLSTKLKKIVSII